MWNLRNDGTGEFFDEEKGLVLAARTDIKMTCETQTNNTAAYGKFVMILRDV